MSKFIHHEYNYEMPYIVYPIDFNDIVLNNKKEELIQISEKIFKEENIIKFLEKLEDIRVKPISLDEDIFYISIYAKDYIISE